MHIYGAWVFDSFGNGVFGDFVEYDTLCRFGVESQDFTQMPCNRLSFAVFISCQPNCLGFFDGLFEFGDDLLFVRAELGELCNGLRWAIEPHFFND